MLTIRSGAQVNQNRWRKVAWSYAVARSTDYVGRRPQPWLASNVPLLFEPIFKLEIHFDQNLCPLYVVFVVCKAYLRESFSGGRTDVQTAEANVSSIEDEDDRACCGSDGEWEEMALLLAAFERSKFRYIPECSVEMHKQQPYVGMDVVRRGDPGAQVLKH